MEIGNFLYLIADNLVKYFLIAGFIFFVFYYRGRKYKIGRKIQTKFPERKAYFRDIGFSLISVTIFSIAPLVLLFIPEIRQLTTFYENIDEYGLVYAVLLFPILLIIHDTYFYWIHRMMHHPFLFRKFHLVHHKSTNPSPWTAYAFHPLEAILEVLIFPIFLFSTPIHSIHLTWFFIFSLAYNVYGHLGYELYPPGFNRHWLGKWINTSVCHNLHHEKFSGNYGLYFTFWDRLCGTLRSDYDSSFEKINTSN